MSRHRARIGLTHALTLTTLITAVLGFLAGWMSHPGGNP